MRRAVPVHRAGWLVARSSFLAALALVAIVNLLYVWPGKHNIPSIQVATPTGTTGARVQSRKELALSGTKKWSPVSTPLIVHLFCGDVHRDCGKQRHTGNCSTHLLRDFHTCPGSCGVCPALDLAIRESLQLSRQQLVEVDSPPECRDHVSGCEEMLLGAGAADDRAGGQAESPGGRCVGRPLALVGACKATCGACTAPPGQSGAGGGAVSSTAATSLGASGDKTGDHCFDAVDMCAWWARTDPRVCERAARDLHSLWWVPVVCRRSCGLCGGLAMEGAVAGLSSSGGVERSTLGQGQRSDADAQDADAAAAAAVQALVAAARFGVQVGEAADGSPRVAVFEALPNDTSSCADKQGQCSTWAAAGECARNPGFMADTCPVACHTCPVLVNLPHPLARIRLNNGVLMPSVGYGSAALGGDTARTVRWALDAGYRHVDSAQAREWYREDLVGAALEGFLRDQAERAAGGGGTVAAGGGSGGLKPARREDIFVTSKLHPRHLGYGTTLRQFNQTLKDLRSPYVDLFLLHYPECWGDLCGGATPEGTFLESWRALEEVYEAGLARAIGVSNFAPGQLSQLLAAARVRPAVLQVHVDPLGRNEAEQEMCRREGLTMTAYSTLGSQWGGVGNPVLGHPALQAMGREAGDRSAAQVALRWALQQGLVVLPRSSNQGRIRQNLQLYDWGLSPVQMGKIGQLRPAAAGAA